MVRPRLELRLEIFAQHGRRPRWVKNDFPRLFKQSPHQGKATKVTIGIRVFFNQEQGICFDFHIFLRAAIVEIFARI